MFLKLKMILEVSSWMCLLVKQYKMWLMAWLITYKTYMVLDNLMSHSLSLFFANGKVAGLVEYMINSTLPGVVNTV